MQLARVFYSLSILLLAVPSVACTLTEGQQSRLGWAEQLRGRPGFYVIRGLVYDEAKCFAEADQSFREAVRELTQPTSEQSEAKAMLKLVQAEEDLQAGRVTEARRGLWEIVRTYHSPNAYSRATMLLASILPTQDSQGWNELQGHLEDLSNGFQDWKALFLLRRKQFDQGDGAGAIQAVETELGTANFPQRQAALEILLSELYLKSGRSLEAAILMKSVEGEIGTTLTDIPLKHEFLALGVKVWTFRAATDPDARDRAMAYKRFLADFDARAGRYY